MSADVAVQAPPLAGRRPRAGNGGRAARRAVVRWAWRLFRREWRQQVLVLALLAVAVAATTAGVAVAANGIKAPVTAITLPGTDPQLAADVDTLRQAFGTVDVVAHRKVPLPGTVRTIDMRAQDAAGPSARSTLRIVRGRAPAGPGEVALTRATAELLDLRVGDTWDAGAGPHLVVVGLVENPQDLSDRFALVAPGQADPADQVTVLLQQAPRNARAFHPPRLPSGAPVLIQIQSSADRNAAAAIVLVIATILLLFVALVAVAGFTVMAQRRLRALGMLESQGATDRHVRLVMIANGAAVGTVAAVIGTVVGLGGWLALAPTFETAVGHRVDRFDLPWWALVAAMVLAVATATAAAWAPARAVSRVPVVAALSGRPPKARPVHRTATSGVVLLAGGLTAMAFAHPDRVPFIIGGTVATALGVLLVAPVAIRAVGRTARHAPIAVRLALRDLARYQARSGAALGAVTLAIGIAVTIAVVTMIVQGNTDTATGGNLPANQLVAHLGDGGPNGGPIPDQTPAQATAAKTAVDAIASALGTHDVVELDGAVNPAAREIPSLSGEPAGREPASLVRQFTSGDRTGETLVAPLYVATPELLALYGIDPARIDPTADVLSARTDLQGLLIGYGLRATLAPTVRSAPLPKYSSGPSAVITQHAVDALGLVPVTSGWLVQTPNALSSSQIAAARKLAAAAGLSIETRDGHGTLTQVRRDAAAIGILLVLGVLAMTVGLMRSESANELRILSATGASSTTRRAVTGTTSGALASLGAVLGTAGAYLALVAWNRSDLHSMRHVPLTELLMILVGLPVVAFGGGWLLAGREPTGMARRTLD